MVEKQYRSQFEKRIASQLKDAGVDHRYEAAELPYESFGRAKRYFPDFLVFPDREPNRRVFVECKGWLRVEDRWKFEKVQQANPGIDLRFCFMDARQTLDDGATYEQWTEGLGWACCEKELPQEWINEWKGGTAVEDY